ncbi:MAG: peptidase MA family metallohydrolase, partial [Bradymonadia bacterium]
MFTLLREVRAEGVLHNRLKQREGKTMVVSVGRWIATLIFIMCSCLPCFVGATVQIESEVPRLRTALEGVVSRFQTDVDQHFSFVQWHGVSVYGVENQKSLEQKRLALGLGKPPTWAFGVCYPASKVIIIRLDGAMEEIERTLVHELVHLIFGVGFSSSEVPSWFSEGVAQMFEQGLTTERRDTLNQVRTRGPPIALEDLTH